MKKKNCLAIVLFMNSLLFYSQSSVNSSSKDIDSSQGALSYSIGQVFSTSTSTSNGSVTNGIQYPFQDYTSLGTESSIVNLQMEVFPNPVVDNLVLTLNNFEIKDLTFVVYNTLGLELLNGKISNITTNINFEKLPGTVYYINVFKNEKKIKTFKILKK